MHTLYVTYFILGLIEIFVQTYMWTSGADPGIFLRRVGPSDFWTAKQKDEKREGLNTAPVWPKSNLAIEIASKTLTYMDIAH